MDEKDSDSGVEEYLSPFDLWTSGLPIVEILALEAEMHRRRPPMERGMDASVIRDHTRGDLDEWLAGRDVATRPDPHEAQVVSWERH